MNSNLTKILIGVFGTESLCFVFNCILVYDGARIAYMPTQGDNVKDKLEKVTRLTNNKLTVINYKSNYLLIKSSNVNVINRLLYSSSNLSVSIGRALGYPYVYKDKKIEGKCTVEYHIITTNGKSLCLYLFVIPKKLLRKNVIEEIILTRDSYSRALGHTVNVKIK